LKLTLEEQTNMEHSREWQARVLMISRINWKWKRILPSVNNNKLIMVHQMTIFQLDFLGGRDYHQPHLSKRSLSHKHKILLTWQEMKILRREKKETQCMLNQVQMKLIEKYKERNKKKRIAYTSKQSKSWSRREKRSKRD